MRRAIVVADIVILLLTGATGASGQSGNYWSEQFGNQSRLLSGAVIGSASDLGMVFYNPGRLSLIESPDLVIAAKALEWERVRLDSGLGDGADLVDTSFGNSPSLAAGVFTLPFLPGHRFAYSFLTRRRREADVTLRTERLGDLLPGSPGEEFYAGTYRVLSGGREHWTGITWSHAPGRHWGLGLSTFYYSLSQRDQVDLALRILTATGGVGAVTRSRGVRYRDQGLIWKAGITGVLQPLTFGVTVTTPRVSISARGGTDYEDLFNGLGDTGDLLVTNIQEGLPAVTRSPWAVGAGVGATWGEVTIHLAGEWYSAVPRYVVTEADRFSAQTGGSPISYRVVEELASVLNGAVGVEWRHGERLSLFGSVATDRSAAPPNRASFLALPDEVSTTGYRLDYEQAGAGIMLSSQYVDLTLGASRSWASDTGPKPVTLPEGGDLAATPGDVATLEVVRWRFLIGFSLPVLDRLRKRIG